ncbi:MAG TPA: hypothetical protein VHJ38_15145 [Nitrososphaeraceae archaeon]|jgi:hypothetical protein|nr:hypothetical protein [Nitrososphaeraceae archaeon]
MSSSTNTTNNQNNINPKSCNYGCNTQIYWHTSVNEYWEVFTKKKHICPNRFNNNKPVTSSNNTSATIAGVSTEPTYYNKKPWSPTPKPKMSNSFELLQGSIAEIQKKYEILSDIVSEYNNGKVFGSQSHISNNNELSIVVYFGVSEGRLNDFKQRFQNNTRAILQQQYLDNSISRRLNLNF